MPKYEGLVFEGFSPRTPLGAAAPAASLPDMSRYGNDGVFTNIAAWTQLPSGLWTMPFNGTTSIITIAANASLSALPQMTFSVWLKPITTGETASGMVFQLGSGSLTPTAGWLLRYSGGENLAFYVNYVTTDLRSVSAINSITLGAYQHFVVVWTGTTVAADIDFYVNGVVSANTANQDAAGARVSDVGSTLYIGNAAATLRTWDGNIGLPKLYNYAMSHDQINAIFEAERRLFGV